MYLFPGAAGFLLFILFDLNKIYWKNRILNLSFILGTVLLLGSTGYAILQSDLSLLFANPGLGQILLFAGLIGSGAALIYALFFALPFEDTYVESENIPVVNKGWYGICRHPGFWMFALFYLFLVLVFRNRPIVYAAVLYNICNFIYIILQDCFIFPRYIRGYEEYKKTVPFLIPGTKGGKQ